jgi:hypothetical protein
LLDARTERPAHFGLAKYWNESTTQFEKKLPQCEVILRLKSETAQELKKRIGVSR